MNWKIFGLSALGAALIMTQAKAADPTPTLLSPGTYMVNVVPTFNQEMGHRIEKNLGTIPGIEAVKTNMQESSIHFTVKEKNQVSLAAIQKTLDAIDKGAVMTTPVLAHTLSSNPGL